MKILLSEGSSTSARQTLYALGRLGHELHVCDPQLLSLGRFSRYVRRYFRCPPFAADPVGYLEFLKTRLGSERYDVLFPVHDQVYLLSRYREELGRLAGVALPEFAAVEKLQSKAALARLLTKLQLPQPETVLPGSIEELRDLRDFPCYVKLSYSTAGTGVWRVNNRAELSGVIDKLERLGPIARQQELVVQQVVQGMFHCAQAVFQQGELVGLHAYRSRATGVGGSAHARLSVQQPLVAEHVSRLGAHLHWHGAMHLEYFCDPQTNQPSYIEANPRIGETMNSTLAGLNLCELLVKVSLGESLPRGQMSNPGVRTHSLLMSLMALAERGENRRAIWRELGEARHHRGIYEKSEDELTRPREDAWCLLPAIEVVAQLLLSPGSVTRTIRRAVESYSLTAEAARRIRQLPA
jgi:predicted ATP-grasp superfamily ATP-dependent carboligase